MTTQLIKIVNRKTHFPLGLFILVWVIVTYMLPQKFPIFGAQLVPVTFIDQAIPLTPEWIWIYVSYYLFLISAFICARGDNANQIFYSYFASAIIGTVIFFLFPTLIDRSLHPISGTSTLSSWLLALIRTTDAPLNCAPSMHIAMTTIAAGTLIRERSWYTWPAITWALLIAYSTMATKQHYWWDVATGFAFGLFVFAFFDRATYIEPQRLSSPKKA
jgi:membrane-associated phospholipid phosphatase